LFCKKASFYGEELSTPFLTPKLEFYPVSAVCDCLFNISAATLHVGGCSSSHNLRILPAMVTGSHMSWEVYIVHSKKIEKSYKKP
jgi:hypothetical protein